MTLLHFGDKQTNRWTGPLHEAALAVMSSGLISQVHTCKLELNTVSVFVGVQQTDRDFQRLVRVQHTEQVVALADQQSGNLAAGRTGNVHGNISRRGQSWTEHWHYLADSDSWWPETRTSCCQCNQPWTRQSWQRRWQTKAMPVLFDSSTTEASVLESDTSSIAEINTLYTHCQGVQTYCKHCQGVQITYNW